MFNQLEHGAVYRNCDDDSVGQCDNDRAVISGPGLTGGLVSSVRSHLPCRSVSVLRRFSQPRSLASWPIFLYSERRFTNFVSKKGKGSPYSTAERIRFRS